MTENELDEKLYKEIINIRKANPKYFIPEDYVKIIKQLFIEYYLDKKRLLQASAQGYCTKRNSQKQLDSNLLEDVIDAIIKDFKNE